MNDLYQLKSYLLIYPGPSAECYGAPDNICTISMGVGTGVATRGIVHRTNFSGMILGIDISLHLVAATQRFTEEEAAEHKVEFRAGDTRNKSTDIDLPRVKIRMGDFVRPHLSQR